MTNDIDITKIIGAPGTGKTTRMVGNPELGLDGLFVENNSEYPLVDQMLVTYTKAGTQEAADRLNRMLPQPRWKIDNRVTTIHSRCFRELNLDGDDVPDWRDKQDFCDQYGLEFGFDNGDGDDIMADEDKNAGNVLIDAYNWLKSNRLELDDYERFPAPWNSDKDMRKMLGRWDSWKAAKGLTDFPDMIEKNVDNCESLLREKGLGDTDIDNCREYLHSVREDPELNPKHLRGRVGFVDTRVLYVDEVQDLTRLQWDWYLCQKLVADKVYLGGDDDQTIYGWSGADSDQMLDEEGKVEVLDKTYRIPEVVWNACDTCIRQVDRRQEKEVSPVDDVGELEIVQYPSDYELIQHIAESDDVLVLFRARFHIDEFRNAMHNYGIPYQNMSTFKTWSDDLLEIRDALVAVLENEDIDLEHVNTLRSAATSNMTLEADFGATGFNAQASVSRKELMNSFNGRSSDGRSFVNWYMQRLVDERDDYNWYTQQALSGNVFSNYNKRGPGKVRIGTIHSSKGREADTVILGTDSTSTILEGMSGDKPVGDDERRVYYVGMSRAKRKLVMAEGVTTDCYLHIADLLNEDYLPEE